MRHPLSGLQLAILQVLWKQGACTVNEVQETLEPQRPLAYSTLATVLARMEGKGVVTHRTEGRTFIYEPLVSEEEASQSMVTELVERIGSPTELVSYLLKTDDVDSRELERIKDLVASHSKKARARKARRPRKGKRRERS